MCREKYCKFHGRDIRSQLPVMQNLTEYWNSKVTGLVAENLVSQLYIHWQAHTSDVFL